MHQALYRKWRPRTFSEVVGQEPITKVLAHEAAEGRLSHAYLFCGSRGTGKTTCAKILAKAANCHNLKNGDPCNECEICKAIDSGASLDVLEMDAASNTGVDYIRDIREEVNFTPSEMGTRVYIIDEVHMLSEGAFNALLKTLEEPPSKVIFILATTELQKIPATILSRCQRFDFRRIPTLSIMERLKYIASEEKIDLTGDGARLIAKLSQGGMRDAVSLLELCSADGQCVSAERVGEISGVVGRASVAKVVGAIQSHDVRTVFEEVAGVYRSSCDLAVFLTDLASFYRDLMVQKALKITSPQAVSKDILDVSDAELSDLMTLAARFRYGTMVYHVGLLESAIQSMARGAEKRITAEVTLLRMCSDVAGDSNEALAAKIAALEDKLTALIASGIPVRLPGDTTTGSAEEGNNPSLQGDAPSDLDRSESGRPLEGSARTAEAPTKEHTMIDFPAFADLVDQFEKVHAAEAPYLRKAQVRYDAVDGKLWVSLPDRFAKLMLDNVHADSALTALAAAMGESVTGVVLRVEAPREEKHDIFDDLV